MKPDFLYQNSAYSTYDIAKDIIEIDNDHVKKKVIVFTSSAR